MMVLFNKVITQIKKNIAMKTVGLAGKRKKFKGFSMNRSKPATSQYSKGFAWISTIRCESAKC